MSVISGKLFPIRDNVIVEEMDFGEQKTNSGLIIMSDDGKSMGIKPRWGRVYAVGPEQEDVQVGDWILIEHGRWTRGFDIEDEEGNIKTLRKADNDAILMISDEKPSDAYIVEEKLLTLNT
jgi:co-chaperonin GroES (HSP10)